MYITTTTMTVRFHLYNPSPLCVVVVMQFKSLDVSLTQRLMDIHHDLILSPRIAHIEI